MIYDLHSHTTASDGSLTPVELVTRADVRQVGVLAVTDHDTVDGLTAAKREIELKKLKLKLVNGVEISTKWHGFEIHIVGLCIDPEDSVLLSCLDTQLKHREIRAQSMSDKLEKKGIENVYQEAREMAVGKCVSRTHFAKVLLQRGVVSNFDAAFKKYLGKGKSAYVSPSWMDIETAVKIIKRAGGISVIAHPIRYDMSNKWLAKLVAEFAEHGGDALEVGLSQQSPNQRLHISTLANNNNLYSSQGSDFHAPARWTDLGKSLYLTEQCKPVWQHPKWRFA
ncbi:PHP domain-containing protein [Psychrosphaera sp. F3M07]|mgnify:CR=1 FL=1|uniref:PHP domain-containing protein n=1 Tax=Psychrosphaera sp. F3M07 TaxID=2841560 RepID=UPI001C097B08|nr:PHP domain-containing protein [Psychrosphaera sp. F3M07]MBU2918610.1 PHP domain-containing protein [Psychrosphaera sp. F3M07]